MIDSDVTKINFAIIMAVTLFLLLWRYQNSKCNVNTSPDEEYTPLDLTQYQLNLKHTCESLQQEVEVARIKGNQNKANILSLDSYSNHAGFECANLHNCASLSFNVKYGGIQRDSREFKDQADFLKSQAFYNNEPQIEGDNNSIIGWNENNANNQVSIHNSNDKSIIVWNENNTNNQVSINNMSTKIPLGLTTNDIKSDQLSTIRNGEMGRYIKVMQPSGSYIIPTMPTNQQKNIVYEPPAKRETLAHYTSMYGFILGSAALTLSGPFGWTALGLSTFLLGMDVYQSRTEEQRRIEFIDQYNMKSI